MKIRAITLHQPYASLMMIGSKRIETRNRALPKLGYDGEPFRGPFVIHAAATRATLSVIESEPLIAQELDRAGLVEFDFKRKKLISHTMPLGAIIGVAEEIESFRQEDLKPALLTPVERACGYYAPGRFGWVTNHMHVLNEPIPYNGHQSLFSVESELFEGRAGRILDWCDCATNDYCENCMKYGYRFHNCADILQSLLSPVVVPKTTFAERVEQWEEESKPRRVLPPPGQQLSFEEALSRTMTEDKELLRALGNH